MATNPAAPPPPRVDGSPLSRRRWPRSILSGIGEIEGIINNLLDWDARRPARAPARRSGPASSTRWWRRPRPRAVTRGVAGGLRAGSTAGRWCGGDGQKPGRSSPTCSRTRWRRWTRGGGSSGRSRWTSSREGDRAVVEVVDDGVGIAHRPARPDSPAVFLDQEPGTGLGLSIVKKFADLHAGSVAIDAPPAAARASASRWPAGAAARRAIPPNA